jgi:hypothetical protein
LPPAINSFDEKSRFSWRARFASSGHVNVKKSRVKRPEDCCGDAGV